MILREKKGNLYLTKNFGIESKIFAQKKNYRYMCTYMQKNSIESSFKQAVIDKTFILKIVILLLYTI